MESTVASDACVRSVPCRQVQLAACAARPPAQLAVHSAGGNCPKDFDVSIEQGGLVLFGNPLLTDAISGPGYLRVLYIVRRPP